MLSIRYNSRIKSGKNKRATQIIAKTKSYIDKYNWKGINYPSEKDDWEKIEKNNLTITLNAVYVKEKKYNLFMLQNITQFLESKLLFFFNNSEWRRMALSCG